MGMMLGGDRLRLADRAWKVVLCTSDSVPIFYFVRLVLQGLKKHSLKAH